MVCETQLAVMLIDKTGEMTSALAARQADRFWAGLSDLLHGFGPRNAALLKTRDDLQARGEPEQLVDDERRRDLLHREFVGVEPAGGGDDGLGVEAGARAAPAAGARRGVGHGVDSSPHRLLFPARE